MAKSNFIVRGGANFNPLYQEFNRAQKKMSAFQTGINKTMKGIGIALGGLAIGKLVKESLSAASELEGAFVGLESILTGQGKSFNKAKGFIDDYISDGLIPLTNAITSYKNLAARGYNDEQIQMTMNRLKDAAAFGRQASYSLGDAVSTATEGLKNENSVLVDNAGVTKNVAKMWDEYAKSIGKNRNQLTQQEKIQAEVNGIMQETQWQVGDAAKYTDTYAGRLAGLSKTLRDIKINLGQAFMPIANVVLPLLQTLANWLSRVTSTLAAFTQALFGKAIMPKKQAETTQMQAGATSDLGDAMTSTGNATEKAGKQAKKALAGFDEINTLSEVDVGGGSGGGGVGGGSSGGGLVEEIDDGTGGAMGDVANKAVEMATKVREAFTNMKDAIVENKNIILPVLGAIAGALVGIAIHSSIIAVIDFFKNFGAAVKLAWGILAAHPLVAIIVVIGALIGALVTAYLTNDKFRDKVDKLWNTIKTALTPAFEKLEEILKIVWNSVMVPMGNFMVGTFMAAFDAIGKIGLWLWKEVMEPLGEGLSWLWKEVVVPLSSIVGEALTLSFELMGFMAETVWKNILIPLGSFLKTVFVDSVKVVIEIFKYWWDNVLKPLGSYISSTFKPIIEALIKVFEFLWNNVFKPLNQFMNSTFKTTFETVTKGIGIQIKSMETIFKGLITFITGVFTKDWGKAWEGVKTIFKGVFDSLYGTVKTPLNLIIDAINIVIEGLNKIKIDVPDWIPGLGGKSYGINVKTIPKLAKGGITNGPMLAMIGDNPGGREVVSPLSDLQDMIASAVGSAMMINSSSNNKPVELKVYLDSREIAREIYDPLEKEKGRRGTPLIQGT